MIPHRTRPYYNSTICQIIRERVEASEKTQAQIAAEAGFPGRNMLSMIKNGVSKLPPARVHGLAKSLKITPMTLIDAAVVSYPDTELWRTIRAAMEQR